MTIRNLKDWSIALDETANDIEKYENLIYNFYKGFNIPQKYFNSLMTQCYKKEKFSKHLVYLISRVFFKVLIVAGIIFAIFTGVFTFSSKGTFADKIKPALIKSGIISCIAFVVIVVLLMLIRYLTYKSQIKQLDIIENNTNQVMITVPSNYRNAEKMRTIAKVYFTKPTVNPKVILDVVNDFLKDTPPTSKYTAVMFDLPCECPFLDVRDSDHLVNLENPIGEENKDGVKKKSKFLPSDIDTKVFAGSEDSDKDLAAMIGLNGVKDQIQKLKNRISFYGKDAANNGNHMAFMGSAGTGKTTVARIVTKMMYDLGYIKENSYIEISGDYLCAGNTSRASAIIEYSYGGVLFIDEAYLMYKTGSEAVGVLLKAMEDHRTDFICILAGYEEQMTKLFASNEGFSSRIKHTIYFSDYNEEEMLDIFNYFISNYNNKHYELSNNAVEPLMNLFKLEKKSKSFGNARTVRNCVDAIMDNYADRSIATKTDTKVISVEDVELFAAERRKVLQHEIKNASAMNQLDESIIRLSELKPRLKEGSNSPTEDMSKLVGLESFESEIASLKNEKEFYGEITHQSILLVGEEGCGKTSITRILTGYLYQMGYIEENKYLDIPAELLKGSFVGHTAKRAEAIISYASGGVLYIRNFNTLVDSDDAFSGEAINAITTAIQENTNVTIVLADSPSMNIDNIRNLFTIVYDFPEYNAEQLLKIFEITAANENFAIEDEAKEALLNHISNNPMKIRDIRQIYTNSVKNHIANFDGNEQNKFILSKNDLVLSKQRIKLRLK